MFPEKPVFSVFAQAKVNLHLAVFDRRTDGFHNLESLFLTVNFGDTLHFYPLEQENFLDLTVEGSGFDLPIEKNLIFKALSLFRGKTGFNQGLKITVEKHIPIGGGLGGGSSDAAATLLALNKLAGSCKNGALSLSRNELLEMAASLGSDVPFFVYQTGAALVTGRGEFVQPVEMPPLSLVLVNPGFASDTAAAFRLLDEHRSKNTSRRDAEDAENAEEIQRSFYRKSASRGPLFSLRLCASNFEKYYNDFLPVFPEPEKSIYKDIISQLREQGAQFAGLSGTGSTCFGVFKKKNIADKAAASLQNKWDFVKSCCTYRNAALPLVHSPVTGL